MTQVSRRPHGIHTLYRGRTNCYTSLAFRNRRRLALRPNTLRSKCARFVKRRIVSQATESYPMHTSSSNQKEPRDQSVKSCA